MEDRNPPARADVSQAELLLRPVARRRERRVRLGDWADWFREDFLRSCFVGGSLAWDGLGMAAVRYALDPYYPGQGASPLSVYLLMLAFLVASVAGEIFLYRKWWPDHETPRGSGFGLSRPEGASAYVYWNLLKRR